MKCCLQAFLWPFIRSDRGFSPELALYAERLLQFPSTVPTDVVPTVPIDPFIELEDLLNGLLDELWEEQEDLVVEADDSAGFASDVERFEEQNLLLGDCQSILSGLQLICESTLWSQAMLMISCYNYEFSSGISSRPFLNLSSNVIDVDE